MILHIVVEPTLIYYSSEQSLKAISTLRRHPELVALLLEKIGGGKVEVAKVGVKINQGKQLQKTWCIFVDIP